MTHLTNTSMIAIETRIAVGELRTAESMATPCSVNTLGDFLTSPRGMVAYFPDPPVFADIV